MRRLVEALVAEEAKIRRALKTNMYTLGHLAGDFPYANRGRRGAENVRVSRSTKSSGTDSVAWTV